MECSNKTEFVKTVTTCVMLVLMLPILVPSVLVTELTYQFVNAHLTLMKTILQSVHNVLTNVPFVSTCQTTVSLVLKEESTHQSVMFQNQPPNLLPSMMYQSDPSELSTVTADVKLVKELETTV
jgi:hypothetical protein